MAAGGICGWWAALLGADSGHRGFTVPGARLLARSPLTGGGSGGPLRSKGLRPGVLWLPAPWVPVERSSPVWVMIPDSVCSCPSASMVTSGAGPSSIACVGQSPIRVQIRSWWWFGLEFFVEFVIVAERGFGQIVGVPHPDVEEVASYLTAGALVDIGPGDLQALVGVLDAQHVVEFANNLHVDLG